MIHPAFTVPVDRFTDLRFKKPLTDGQYTLGIRPEDVLTTLQAGLFQTEVKSVELIGRERILNFDLADKHMKSIVSIEEIIEEGAQVSFDFHFKKPLSLMKKESGSTNVQKIITLRTNRKHGCFTAFIGHYFLIQCISAVSFLHHEFPKGTLINQQYAGLENYQRVLTDPVFFRALQNTALFAFAVVPIALILSLAIAWIILKKSNTKVFETIFFMPYVTSTIAIGIVFRYFSMALTGSLTIC